ncbi:MAG: FG-GAP repeat protein [Deltaproteobacteria bacterium]|nr:FG-GAP repeat protein [Deltaproteobacteria bacterium]
MLSRVKALVGVLSVAGLLVACDNDGPRPVDGGNDGKVVDANTADGTTGSCEVRISKINGTDASNVTQIDSSLDQDANTAGVQINVEATVLGVADGATVSLAVTGLAQAVTATLSGGKAVFTNVTVDPETNGVLTFTPSVTGQNCTATASNFNTQADPTCKISTPKDGTTLVAADDKVPGDNAFQHDVIVETTNSAGGTIELKIENTTAGTSSPDATGKATFASVTLPKTTNKTVKLEATVRVGALTSNCTVTVTLDIDAPTCVLGQFSPAPKSTTKGDGLGPDQDADKNTAKTQTTIEVTSDADQVELFVGSTSQGKVTPTGGKAAFNLNLDDGTHTYKAICTATGSGNSAETNAGQIIVDTALPARVQDLACVETNHRSRAVNCTFTVPSDGTNGSGIEKCQLAWADDTNNKTNVDEGIWNLPTTFGKEFAVGTGAHTEPLTVERLSINYEFGVRCIDYLGNVAKVESTKNVNLTMTFKLQSIAGAVSGESFGRTVAAGDFDCDGDTDVAVAAPKANGGKGTVVIYKSDGVKELISSLPITIQGTNAGTKATGWGFGLNMRALDFNGDGCDDLLIGTGNNIVARDGSGNGRIYLYLGTSTFGDRLDEYDAAQPTKLPADMVWELPAGSAAADTMAYQVEGIDHNGDAKDDMVTVVVSGGAATVVFDYGEALTPVDSASASTHPTRRVVPTAADLTITGASSSAFFGSTIGGLGNIDGDADNTIDLFVGEIGANTFKGKAFIIKGGKRSGVSTITLADPSIFEISGGSDAEQFYFGMMGAGVGDLNNDGVPEFAIASPFYGQTADKFRGQIWIFNLKAGTPTSVSDAVAVLENNYSVPLASANMGQTIVQGSRIDPVKGADFNKDGIADLVISINRTATIDRSGFLVYFGVAGANVKDYDISKPDLELLPPVGTGAAGLGFSADFLPDLDKDGFVDLCLGNPNYQSGGQPVGGIAVFH